MASYKVILGIEKAPHIREIEFNENSGEIYLDDNHATNNNHNNNPNSLK